MIISFFTVFSLIDALCYVWTSNCGKSCRFLSCTSWSTNACFPFSFHKKCFYCSKPVRAPSSLSAVQSCLHKYLLVGKSHSSLPRDDEGRGPKYKTMVQDPVLPFHHKSLPEHIVGTCIQSNLWKVKLDQAAQKTRGWLPNRDRSREVGRSCKLSGS